MIQYSFVDIKSLKEQSMLPVTKEWTSACWQHINTRLWKAFYTKLRQLEIILNMLEDQNTSIKTDPWLKNMLIPS